MLEIDGRLVINPINQEIVTFRRMVPGEYVVNLHYYKSNTNQPVTAEVSFARVNPVLEILYYGKVELNSAGDERTAVRFRMNPDGSIADINTMHKSLVSVEAG